MNSKELAAKRLREEYMDEYNRVTLSPAKNFSTKEGRYENGNFLLFTGEAMLLLKKQGLLEEADFQKTVDAYKCCEVMPGLFTRQPDPYRFTPDHDVVSHDEYNGVMYAASVFPELRGTLAKDVCNYGDENGFEFNDTPNFENKSYFKELMKSPIQTLLLTLKMIRMMINKEEYRKKVGIAENLTQKRQLRDICFYRITSTNDSPGFIETAYLAISTMLATRKPVDYKSNSGRMMVLYRIWAIEEMGFKSKMLDYAHSYFRKKCKEQFGENYVEELHRRYFKRDATHPFHELCKGLK